MPSTVHQNSTREPKERRPRAVRPPPSPDLRPPDLPAGPPAPATVSPSARSVVHPPPSPDHLIADRDPTPPPPGQIATSTTEHLPAEADLPSPSSAGCPTNVDHRPRSPPPPPLQTSRALPIRRRRRPTGLQGHPPTPSSARLSPATAAPPAVPPPRSAAVAASPLPQNPNGFIQWQEE